MNQFLSWFVNRPTAECKSRCTNQGHQKPLDSKDDNTEKHCPVTVNPWHMKKAFKVMNELRR
ncbi:hypothetical protein FD754_009755 [Muntiacus muntjak]|uniref:Uncharacterized protein n=1 Tax=Muntiacus muntjak TaxID=9888 RepID=A0A5N3WUL6_MUNMU|nr:hypothetical protein FD754_009755 [Muntiacus muntjak]